LISVVIPTLNEAGCIRETLICLVENAIDPIEIIVADGGSVDNTAEIVAEFDVKVVHCGAGRSAQMNAGAAVATSEILLFLHGDTRVPKGFDRMMIGLLQIPDPPKSPLVRGTMRKKGGGEKRVVAGAFNLQIDGEAWALRFVEWGVKVRSTFFQLPYGDQAIFLKASTFHEFGGFPELPIMEDFVLVRSLAKCGKIAIVPAAVITSARRWERQGVIKTTLINQLMIVGYALGISPDRLRQWYRSGLKPLNSKISRYTQKQ
jgi:rSAM/selenodomain-associated transferase 2